MVLPGAAQEPGTPVFRAGVSAVKVDVQVDPDRLRPVDVPLVRGDSTKLRSATGWEPEIPLEQTLADVLAWWRTHV